MKIAPLVFGRPSGKNSTPGSPGADHADEFRRLVLPHLDGAYNFACYLTRDPVASQDITQEAFVRAFRAFSQFRGDSPRAWLFAIVRNCCRTAQNGRARPVSLVVSESSLSADEAVRLQMEVDPSPTPEDEVIHKSEVDRVRGAIEAIPEPFREAIVLREMEGLSYAEIAQTAGIPIGTVMSRLARGRSILTEKLLPSASPSADQSRSAK